MSLAPGSENEVDKRIAKFFGAYSPARDMKAVYHYVDEDGVRDAAGKLGNAGATPSGFVDYKSNPMAVYINRNTKLEGTVEHETLHLYGIKLLGFYGAGKDKVSHLFEGLTEYFTRKIVSGPRTSYAAEFSAAKQLADLTGDANLQTMFFQAKANVVIDCLTQPVYIKWRDFVNDQNWGDAEKCLKARKPCTGSKP